MGPTAVAEQGLWARRVVLAALVAVFGGPALAAVITWTVGDWRVEGTAAVFVGTVWLATFGMVAACLARTRPLVLGAMAAEAAAISSLLGAPPEIGPSVFAFSMAAGMAGGALGGRLVEQRHHSPGEDRLLAAVAILAGVVFVAASPINRRADDRPPGAVATFVDDGEPAVPQCPVWGRPTDEDGVTADLDVPDEVGPGEALPVEFEVAMPRALLREMGPGEQRFSVVVTPERDTSVVYRQEVVLGPLRRATEGSAEVPLLQPACGPGGPPAPGRYRAQLELDTATRAWVSDPAVFTVTR